MNKRILYVDVIYPEDLEDLQRRQAKAVAKIIVDKFGFENIDSLVNRLKK